MPQIEGLQGCSRNYALVRIGIALLGLSWGLYAIPPSPGLISLLAGYLVFGLISAITLSNALLQQRLVRVYGFADAIFIGTTLSLHAALPLLLATPLFMAAGRWALAKSDHRQLVAQILVGLSIAWGVSGWHLPMGGQVLGALYLLAAALLTLKADQYRRDLPATGQRSDEPTVADDDQRQSPDIETALYEEPPCVTQRPSRKPSPRILYLPGRTTDASSISAQFKGWGFNVDASSDLARLVTLAYPSNGPTGNLPQALVLDLRGRPEDPFDIARLFRSSPALTRLRLVLITHMLSQDQRAHLLRSGYASVITDPGDKRLLFNALHADPEELGQQQVTSLVQHYMRNQNPLPQLQVLLAMPSRVPQQIAKQMLEREGHSVLAVESGEQALDAMASQRFDVALIHRSLPDMDGYEVIQIYRLTQSKHLTSTLLLLCEQLSPEVERHACQAGASGVLALPIQPSKLRQHLHPPDNQGIPDSTGRCNLSPPVLSPDRSVSLLDRTTLLDLEQLGNGLDFVQKLTDRFIADSKNILNELTHASEQRDAETFRDCAHALKGSAASVGATRLQRYCLSLASLGNNQLFENQDRLLRHLGDSLEEANDALLKYINQRQEQASQH